MLGLLLLAGCAKRPAAYQTHLRAQQERTQMRSLQTDQASDELNQVLQTHDFSVHSQQEYEARCEDICIPLAAVADGYETDPEQANITLYYYSSLSQQELNALYTSEMERLGWDCEYTFGGCGMVIIFKKPHKVCMVSYAPVGKGRMNGQQHLVIRYKNA